MMNMCVCPTCGDIGFCFTNNTCQTCKVKVIDTKMPVSTDDETECYKNMLTDEREEWKQEMREKYCDIDPKMVKKREHTERANERAEQRRQEYINKPKPKCPTCGSENIQKIGSLERSASVLTLGLFSKKINKTFKCNNCKYTW